MQIIPLIEQYKEQWDKVVYGSDEAWMFHLYDWGTEISQKIWKYKSLSFLIKDDNKKIVGIFPLFLKEQKILPFLKLRVLSSGFGIGGLALINGLGDQYRKKIQGYAFNYVDSLANQYKVDKLEISLPPLALANLPPLNKRINPLLFYGLKDNLTATYLIKLDKEIDELQKNMKGGCRRAIKKAIRSSVTIRRAKTKEDIQKYYELHCETYRRTGVKPHPFAYFETIFNRRWANIFFAEYKNKIISAINIAAFKAGVVYWTGASLTKYMNLRPANLLQWHAIKWAKQRGYKWYESSEAWLSTDNSKLAGLTQFKESFGGELYPFYKGEKIYHPLKLQFFEFLRTIKMRITSKLI